MSERGSVRGMADDARTKPGGLSDAEKVAAVEQVIKSAHRISTGPGMTVYVADLLRALGHNVPVVHKKGQAD